jgi:hypothetical protein
VEIDEKALRGFLSISVSDSQAHPSGRTAALTEEREIECVRWIIDERIRRGSSKPLN